MRKIACLFFVTIFLLSCPFYVNASTNTFTRTRDNLLVSDDIDVSDDNIDYILSTPAVDASEKIYDFADLLTDEEEKKLYDDVMDFIDISDLDLAIVTVSSYQKSCIPETCSRVYAEDFYDYNDFGTDSSHSGILFLVDMLNREIYICTTGKAEEIYTESRVDRILNAIYLYFSQADYANRITKIMTILENYDTIGVSSLNDSRYEIKEDGTVVREFPYLIVFGIPLLITAIVMGIMIYKNKIVRKATSSREYLDKESLKMNVVSDRLISTHTSATPIYQSSSSGGSHSGSSGRSHGGGGRHF